MTGRHLIDGCWVAEATREADQFNAVNPRTGGALPTRFAEATGAEVEQALAAAQAAFHATSLLPPRWPVELLEAIANEIEALGDSFLERIELETALPRARLLAERVRTCLQLRLFAEIVRKGSWVEAVIDLADPRRQPTPKPDLRRMLRPRGPVVVFGASNFPLAYGACGGDVASALAAGNPVVVKGHPSHPGASEMLAGAVAAALHQCRLPRGLFALLQGRRHELGARLVEHPSTQAVGFTGSHRGGRALFDLASRRPTPIPVYAEMGSLNPVVILPRAVAERTEAIAAELSASMLGGGGQFCTKPGVVLVVGDRDRHFSNELARHAAAAPVATLLNRDLRDAFANRTTHMRSVKGVADVVSGMPSEHAGHAAVLMETTAPVFLREPELREEAFGPGGLVVHCTNVEDAIACVECIGGALTGTVHKAPSENEADVTAALRAMEHVAGRVIVNGYPTGVEVCGAIVHSGPYPATTDAGTTSVGPAAMRRFVRLVAYQNVPDSLLPPALQDGNPLGVNRTLNGAATSDPIERGVP